MYKNIFNDASTYWDQYWTWDFFGLQIYSGFCNQRKWGGGGVLEIKFLSNTHNIYFHTIITAKRKCIVK